MKHAARPRNNFAAALRHARKALGISQEHFAPTSGRTYVSELERGLKSPTLEKVDELADVLDLHPLTLLALAYTKDASPKSIEGILKAVEGELQSVLAQKH